MSKHTQGEWDVNEFTDLESDHHIQVVLKSNGCPIAHLYECGSETRHNARLIAAAPEYHDAAFWIRQAVANNAAPVNPLAALEEMALEGKHITLDAGLVLDLLKAHAWAAGQQ